MTTTASPSRTIVVTTSGDPREIVQLPSMGPGKWLVIEPEAMPNLLREVPGSCYSVRITGLTSSNFDMDASETYELQVVAVKKRTLTNGTWWITQIQHALYDPMREDVRYITLSSARLGEWLLGSVERRNRQRRKRDGELHDELRKAIAAAISAFEASPRS